MQATRTVTTCPEAVRTRMVSPSPTDTSATGPAGAGWVAADRLGPAAAERGAAAVEVVITIAPLGLLDERPPLGQGRRRQPAEGKHQQQGSDQ
jgi:hypothetical protein